MKKGWFQIGFINDFENPVSAVATSAGPLMVINIDNQISVYSAICPHRGANLGIDGVLEGEGIRCSFHGCIIGLDCVSKEGYQLKAIKSLQVASLLFITFSPEMDMGFTEYITALDDNHMIIPGFQMEVKTKPEMVIENAFDQMHFRTVHSILNEPFFDIIPSENGEFSITGTFNLPVSQWQTSTETEVSVPYQAKAFSPYLVVSKLDGNDSYHVITSSRETKQGHCLIALSIAIPYQRFDAAELELYQYLIRQSYEGLKLDKVIWENMTDSPQRFQKREKAVIGFQLFCKSFFSQETPWK